MILMPKDFYLIVFPAISLFTSYFCGNALRDMGLWRGVLHSMVSNTGQKMLPSAPPSQSFMAGRHKISVKKFKTASTMSAVTVKPKNVNGKQTFLSTNFIEAAESLYCKNYFYRTNLSPQSVSTYKHSASRC